MRVPSTQQAIERFEENDSFLHACLGLVALVPEFDRLLATLLGPAEPGPADTSLERDRADEPLLDVALGMIALRLQLGVQLDRLASESVPIPPPHANFEPDLAQELLR